MSVPMEAWQGYQSRRSNNWVGDARRKTRWSVSAAGVGVVVERKLGLNPPEETIGTRHEAATEVLEKIWELQQTGDIRQRATRPCRGETW